VRKSLLALSLAGLVTSVGCASVQAKGKPADAPALNVPPPPPRIIEPAEVPPEPVTELPAAPPAPSRSTTTRPALPKPEVPKAAETKPAEAKPDPPVEPLPPPPAPPPAQLRTPQTADANSTTKAVRTTIDTAWGILNGVDFGHLSDARKKAYNDAKLLLQQAEDALKAGNLTIAQGVANKGETLAKELAGR
jgi:hypothetical protein